MMFWFLPVKRAMYTYHHPPVLNNATDGGGGVKPRMGLGRVKADDGMAASKRLLSPIRELPSIRGGGCALHASLESALAVAIQDAYLWR